MLLGRKKVEPTKVVFKKNTSSKKGVALAPSNQRLTKFFGVKKPVEHSQDYEFGDHDDIDDDKSTVEKDTVKSLTNFAFKKQGSQQHHNPSDETTEVKVMITQAQQVEETKHEK